MSGRRRRYPKRSEIEGPPPNYGAESGESDAEESSDGVEVITDSEDTDQKDTTRTGRKCRVDLPSLRVERGSSEDVVIPRQATQFISVKVQMGGKLTKEKVTRMFREKKLSKTVRIRVSGVEVLLKFVSVRAAVKAMDVFDSKFLSSMQNMKFVKKNHQFEKTSSAKESSGGHSGSSSSKLRKEIVFIYFELKKRNKMSEIQVLVKSQKKIKTWNQTPHHTLLSSMLSHLNSTCKDTSITAVFVCSNSAQMFHSLLQAHQLGDHFSAWTDLTSCVRLQLDQNDLKVSSYDPDKLAQLAGQKVTAGTETAVMEKIYSSLKTVETQAWQVKDGKYLTVMLSMDLMTVTPAEDGQGTYPTQAPVVASIGMYSSAHHEWSTAVIPDTARGVVDTAQAGRLGIKLVEGKAEKKWIYQVGEETASDCLSSRSAAHGLVSTLEKEVMEGQFQGVLLVTLADDLTLAHLLAIIKSHSLVQRFRKLVVGFSNLESVWKLKMDSDFDLTQLELHYSNKCGGDLKQLGTSVRVARAGLKVMLDMMDNKLDHNNFVSKFTFPLSSEKFNDILETAVNTLDMAEFDDSVFDIIVATQLSVEAGRLAVTSLQLSPSLAWVPGCQFSIQHSQAKLQLQSDVQTANSQARITMTVTNISTTRVKLGVGTRFGWARLLPDVDMEGLGDGNKNKYKPKKRIHLKKLEAESSDENSETESSDVEVFSSSDEDGEPSMGGKVRARKAGPASSKLTRSRRSQVSLAGHSSAVDVDGGKTRLKVDGQEDVEAITSLEEYRKKVKEEEVEGESIEYKTDVSYKDKNEEGLSTGSSTPEILKSLGGNDFMKELKETLDKSSDPAELDIDAWEDLSPSLEGIDLDASFNMEDISENPLSSCMSEY